MKLLSIDSSGLVATVGLYSDGTMLAEYTTNFKKTHSQTLLPMIDEIVTMVGLELNELDAIAVAAGPGSFTGLRIGSSTAKGLGLVLNIPIISVPTVEGLAYNLCMSDKLICPIMDARRNQVYTGLYEFKNEEMVTVKEQQPIAIEDIIEEIDRIGKEVVFLGDGVPVYKEIIEEKLKVSYSFAPAHMAMQRAGAVAVLGEKYYKEGKYEAAEEHKPVYLRLSQAERELKEKQEKMTK